jgi:hypothetical protein
MQSNLFPCFLTQHSLRKYRQSRHNLMHIILFLLEALSIAIVLNSCSLSPKRETEQVNLKEIIVGRWMDNTASDSHTPSVFDRHILDFRKNGSLIIQDLAYHQTFSVSYKFTDEQTIEITGNREYEGVVYLTIEHNTLWCVAQLRKRGPLWQFSVDRSEFSRIPEPYILHR